MSNQNLNVYSVYNLQIHFNSRNGHFFEIFFCQSVCHMLPFRLFEIGKRQKVGEPCGSPKSIAVIYGDAFRRKEWQGKRSEGKWG